MKAAFYLATLMCGTFFGSTISYAVSWLQVPGPEATQASCSISGIAVLGESDVWTVGSKGFSLNLPMQPLIEHWDGISWAQVRQPCAELGGALEAIAARSSDDVWAVGWTAQDQTLVERWNGRKWLVIPSPTPGSVGFLHAVCVISPDDVWAAGESLPHSYILMHWDGTVWSLVDGPSVDRSAITSLKAFASDDIWAVGYKDLHVSSSSNFTLHWDGSAWSEVPSPDVGNGNLLEGVDGTAPNDVWAVGHAKLESYRPVALHWGRNGLDRGADAGELTRPVLLRGEGNFLGERLRGRDLRRSLLGPLGWGAVAFHPHSSCGTERLPEGDFCS